MFLNSQTALVKQFEAAPAAAQSSCRTSAAEVKEREVVVETNKPLKKDSDLDDFEEEISKLLNADNEQE